MIFLKGGTALDKLSGGFALVEHVLAPGSALSRDPAWSYTHKACEALAQKLYDFDVRRPFCEPNPNLNPNPNPNSLTPEFRNPNFLIS